MKSIQVSDELHEEIMNLREPYQEKMNKLSKGINVTGPTVIGAGIVLLRKYLEQENAHN